MINLWRNSQSCPYCRGKQGQGSDGYGLSATPRPSELPQAVLPPPSPPFRKGPQLRSKIKSWIPSRREKPVFGLQEEVKNHRESYEIAIDWLSKGRTYFESITPGGRRHRRNGENIEHSDIQSYAGIMFSSIGILLTADFNNLNIDVGSQYQDSKGGFNGV